MSDFGGMYVFLLMVLLIILFVNINTRFGNTERELNAIKKKIDDLLKAQKQEVADPVKERAEVKQSAPIVKEQPILEKVVPEAVMPEAIIPERVIPKAVTPEAMIPEREVWKEESVEEKRNEKEEMLVIEETDHDVLEKVSVSTPVTPSRISAASAAPKKKDVNYEKFIGENLFGKIGILVFVIGVGLFVKYAIDKDWINETMRTVLGFLTGSALLAVAERLQKKYRTFSSLLAGGAFAVFYITVAIAYHYYHLFSQMTAFVALVCVTIAMSLLSVLYDRRELAVTSLVGGFLAPFLVSSGEGNYLVLFTYLTILNMGMFGLSLYKKWGELSVISFVFTYLVMGVYWLTGYRDVLESTIVSRHMFVFATLFYFIFVLPVLYILKVERKNISRILLSVVVANSFLYLLFGSLFLRNMMLPFDAQGLLCLFIAIVNLCLVIWLRKSKQDYNFLTHAMLGLVLTFVSITVPIQLDGNFITLFWASEMVLLLWLYMKSKIRVYEYATVVLIFLTVISYLMDVFSFGNMLKETIFLNSAFATSLFVGLAMGASALLMERNRSFFSTARILNYTPWNGMMLLGLVIVLYYTFYIEFSVHLQGDTRTGALMLFTVASVFTVCYAFGKRYPIAKYTTLYLLSMALNVLIYMVGIWLDFHAEMAVCPVLLRWLAAAFVIAHFALLAKRYYESVGHKTSFTVYLNILSTLLLLTMVRSFLWQVGIYDFSAGFSLSLCAAGLAQMALGMRLHQKVLRVVSLFTFGIVLGKLALVDLWGMQAIGKIIVFIILGLILLVLSFLYQKLKDVLFKNDEDEVA